MSEYETETREEEILRLCDAATIEKDSRIKDLRQANEILRAQRDQQVDEKREAIQQLAAAGELLQATRDSLLEATQERDRLRGELERAVKEVARGDGQVVALEKERRALRDRLAFCADGDAVVALQEDVESLAVERDNLAEMLEVHQRQSSARRARLQRLIAERRREDERED